jgi:hypothetical protein
MTTHDGSLDEHADSGPPSQPETPTGAVNGRSVQVSRVDWNAVAEEDPGRVARVAFTTRDAVGHPGGTRADGTPFESTGLWRALKLGVGEIKKEVTDLGARFEAMKLDQGAKLDQLLAAKTAADAVREEREKTRKDIGLSTVKSVLAGVLLMLVGAAFTYLGLHAR